MARAPRLGSPEWSRLVAVTEALAVALEQPQLYVSIPKDDARWLAQLLTALMAGEDVSKRFAKNAKPKPNAERHFWIACDVAQHLHDRKRPARELVAQRWDVSVENVEAIVKRQRRQTAAVARLLGEGFAAVIEWHRVRLRKGT